MKRRSFLQSIVAGAFAFLGVKQAEASSVAGKQVALRSIENSKGFKVTVSRGEETLFELMVKGVEFDSKDSYKDNPPSPHFTPFSPRMEYIHGNATHSLGLIGMRMPAYKTAQVHSKPVAYRMCKSCKAYQEPMPKTYSIKSLVGDGLFATCPRCKKYGEWQRYEVHNVSGRLEKTPHEAFMDDARKLTEVMIESRTKPVTITFGNRTGLYRIDDFVFGDSPTLLAIHNGPDTPAMRIPYRHS